MNTDKFPFKKTFKHTGEDFSACHEAEAWLRENGFSIGTMEGSQPRAILHSHTFIPKWKHLDHDDKEQLDGVAISDNFREKDVMVHLKFDPNQT